MCYFTEGDIIYIVEQLGLVVVIKYLATASCYRI